MSQYAFLILLVLVCPLVMWLMMRGGHRHRHGGARSDAASDEAATLKELRRRVDELDRRIQQTGEASDDRAAAQA